MSLDPRDPRVEWATFGKEVENFVTSTIGDYLLKRSEREITVALSHLKTVSPWRRRRIMDLQNQIKVAEMFQLWLADSIAEGHDALEQLQEENGR